MFIRQSRQFYLSPGMQKNLLVCWKILVVEILDSFELFGLYPRIRSEKFSNDPIVGALTIFGNVFFKTQFLRRVWKYPENTVLKLGLIG